MILIFKLWHLDDGSMNAKDREVALTHIKTSTTTKVILISFKAGSTGRSFDDFLYPFKFTGIRVKLDCVQ